jgi:broad specificity phosphatase PhoE
MGDDGRYSMENKDSYVDINWSGYITLVRHGETIYNTQNRFVGITDDPLNEIGLEQARSSAIFLYNWSKENKIVIEKILSSPLKRCYNTAEEFGRVFKLDVQEEPLLIERNYGIFEGVNQEEAALKWPDLYRRYQVDKPFVQLPNGETAEDVEYRVRKLLFEKFPSLYKSIKEILIVSHLNPIRAFFHLLGLADWDIYFKSFHNTSISRIRIESNQCRFDFCDKSTD